MRSDLYTGRKILVVVAHPDDETFGMGGTLAFYAHQGAEIHVICTTRGEAGEVAEEFLEGFSSIGELREYELLCAANVLKLRKVHILNYRDSGMRGSEDNYYPEAFINAPPEKIAEEIALLIRKIQPDVMLTFDPIGGYMHPDHVAVHQATLAAIDLAGNENYKLAENKPFKPRKLYFHIFPRNFFRVILPLLPLFGIDPSRFGRNKDINLTAILAEDFPVHCRIDHRKYASIRAQAAACHASQGGDNQGGKVITWFMRLVGSREVFMRAFPPVQNHRIEKDLFEGL